MEAWFVVGAGYGDEGKGLATDWLSSRFGKGPDSALVIRANGGTQAAHTVQTPGGRRHVFNHHGSGSFHFLPTYLGPEFIVNPIGFWMEREKLGLYPKIYCSPKARISIPADMMVNQMSEEARGAAKFGSCGWGVGETMCRNLQLEGVGLTVEQCVAMGPEFNMEFISDLTRRYINQKVKSFGIPEEWSVRLQDRAVLGRWLEETREFLDEVEICDFQIAKKFKTLIFEGAQGLGLDEWAEHFPHVTWSRTGSDNPLALLRELGEKVSLTVLYMTRAYATRHGAGPLEHEGADHGCVVDDPTNVPNKWQDSLRSAPLDLDLLAKRISSDFQKVYSEHPRATLAVGMTCLDQAGSSYSFFSTLPVANGLSTPHAALGMLAAQIARVGFEESGMKIEKLKMITSSGPTRETVREQVSVNGSSFYHLFERC